MIKMYKPELVTTITGDHVTAHCLQTTDAVKHKYPINHSSNTIYYYTITIPLLTLSAVDSLFSVEHVLVELLLQTFVREVDAELR